MPGMHFQSLFFLPLSAAFGDDVLAYSLIWAGSLLFSGLATFWLAFRVTGDRLASALAGLLFLLGAPVLFNAHGALEMLSIGWFPLFLAAWLDWIDRPSRRGLAATAGLYVALMMGAPYFGIYGAFPAALYAAIRLAGAARRGEGRAWLRSRVPGLSGFVALVVPAAAVLFAGQLAQIAHGGSMVRPDAEFDRYGTTLWGYLLPGPSHPLHRLAASTPMAEWAAMKVPSYLGIVTIGLLAYAGARRVRFPRAGFWWAALGLTVLLSLGTSATIGPIEVPLPAGLLREYTPVFRPVRVPARFNLFAACSAAVIAAAALRDLLGRRRPAVRWATVAGLACLAVADLSEAPFPTVAVPPTPAFYGLADEDEAVLEAPQGDVLLSALCGYWQADHGGRTSAGYTSFPNREYEDLLTATTPFHVARLRDPNYLADPDREAFDLSWPVSARDYTWLYLSAHGFRYLVLHKQGFDHPEEAAAGLDRVQDLLKGAAIAEDDQAIVYDRRSLPTPTTAAILCAEGWGPRILRADRRSAAVERTARLVLYNPDPGRPLHVGFAAAGHRSGREVRLLGPDGELARWSVPSGAVRPVISPPLRLPGGLVELTLQSDGDDRPASTLAEEALGSDQPFSLWVSSVSIYQPPAAVAAGPDRATRAE